MRAASRHFVVLSCCVTYLVGVLVALLLARSPQITNTQTINIEQRDQLSELIKQELLNHGLRNRMERTAGGDGRPDRE